jgi:hypothetical protein
MPFKPSSSRSQARVDRTTYVPPQVQQQMTQHMQQNLPQHLKKYVGENAAYVPKHMEAQLNQAMTKNMPAHMKKYAGAYMQQQVVQPNTTRLHTTPQPHIPAAVAPMPDKLRLDHSQYGEQHTIDPASMSAANLFRADANQAPQPAQPQAPPPHQPYDFIMNPASAPKAPLLPGGNSLLKRVLVVGGGLVLLLIVFSILKGVLGGGSNLQSYVGIAQDQQGIIHIVNAATQQKDLSQNSLNFATTAQLSLSSAQSDLVDYLGKNGQKLDRKQLNLGVSTALDKQLGAAIVASTYEQTFREVMQNKLTEYMSDLQKAFGQSKGKNGRTLLSDDYKQAKLLAAQLGTTTAQD